MITHGSIQPDALCWRARRTQRRAVPIAVRYGCTSRLEVVCEKVTNRHVRRRRSFDACELIRPVLHQGGGGAHRKVCLSDLHRKACLMAALGDPPDNVPVG
eukprot:scaffold8842_cov57-Phaeocystis_antarctica.AAC.1